MAMRAILPFLFLFSSSIISAQNVVCEQTDLVLQMINKFHYNPESIDSSKSDFIFESVLDNLDPNGLYFTSVNLTKLEPYRASFIQVNSGKVCAFSEQVASNYQSALLNTQLVLSELGSAEFDFGIEDSIRIHSDELTFSKNENTLKTKWINWIKYEALSRFFSSVSIDKLNDGNLLKEKFNTTKKNIITNIIAKEQKRIALIFKKSPNLKELVAEQTLKAVCSVFDPHSEYLSSREKKDFEAQLSTNEFSFGFSLDENENGEIVISNISPGGPAWIGGEINKDDILIGIHADGAEPIDMSYSFLDEVHEAINQTNSEGIKFTLRKKSGEVRSVKLTKTNVESQENFISCFVLQGEKKIGYISLPAFYTDFENPDELGCANDVAKAILKLQSEKVEGIILDLRNNGGGSLKEALDLAGIFINEGFVLMQANQDKKGRILKDPNRGAVYTGPLAVMVNGFSASASEIVSSILQDYNRAVIVGSATYGKATSQVILPLDANLISGLPPKDLNKAPGYLKVTMTKFYRMNSVSYQHNGVQPDVKLPDYLASLELNEANLLFSLTSDTLARKLTYLPQSPLPLKVLNSKSKLRVDNYSWTNEVKHFSAQTNRIFFPAFIPVSYNGFKKRYQQNGLLMTKFRSALKSPQTPYEAKITSADIPYAKVFNNSYQAALENIKEDSYLAETYLILSDLVEFK